MVWAQADAQQSFLEARRQYDAGNFQQARGLLIDASHTDADNPEVFLWLGRAHYELAELDQALTAFRLALRLAPDEPYATRMVEALRGAATEVEPQIRLLGIMLREGLLDAASRQCEKLLDERALTTAQRSRVLRLQAEVRLEQRRAADALAIIHQLQAGDATQREAAETLVVFGRARLSLNQDVEGLALLRQVLADHAGTPAAFAAELAILQHQLKRAPSPERTGALARWIEAHGDHHLVTPARQALIEAWLQSAAQRGVPKADSPLDDAVKSALSMAQQVYEALDAKRDAKLTARLLQFIEDHYGCRGARAAANDGVTRLLQRPLPPADRRRALAALAHHQTELAFHALNAQANAGTLASGQPVPRPDALEAVLRTLDTIAAEFPAQAAWDERATLVERVRALAALVAWPEPVTRPRAPSSWAVDIALPAVTSASAGTADRATQTVLQVVRELVPRSHDVALSVLARLLEALPSTAPRWRETVLLRIEILDAFAHRTFEDNRRQGRDTENAALTDVQRQLVTAQTRLVVQTAAAAEAARQQLAGHLQPWIEHGHFTVAEQAFGLLLPALPAAHRRQVQLTIAQLWIEEVLREHRRLRAIGLTVPRQLNPRLAQALQELVRLQQGIPDAPEFGAAVRQAWNGIVAHYRALGYYDIAEQALGVHDDTPVPAAAENAELQRAQLRSELAARELARLVRRHEGRRRIELTPAFRAALDAYLKFLTDHPTSALATAAVDGILRIASQFEQHRAHGIAAVVLHDFATAAEQIPFTGQVEPGGSTVAERMWLRRAHALDAAARGVLQEQLAHRPPGSAPSRTLSDEFATAITAYREFLSSYPRSALFGQALSGVMAIGAEHARVGAWAVAEQVYADLRAVGLALRHPESLEFCRGVCKLGPSMPAHALQVLQAVVAGKAPSSGPAPADSKAGHKREVKLEPALSSAVVRLVKAETRSRELERGSEDVLQVIRNHEASRAALVAGLRDEGLTRGAQSQQGRPHQDALSVAEVARLRAAIDAAYEVFVGILRSHPDTATAQQARAEVLVMVSLWRGHSRWQDAAHLAERFLRDQPDDVGLPQLRLEAARDYLALAGMPVEATTTRQAMLAVVVERFDEARTALKRIGAEFPRLRDLVHQAQWDIARSWLSQARSVAAFSSTLARGQFVRASHELQQVATAFHDHPNIAQVPEMLWCIGEELVGKRFFDEAILVFSDLTVRHPAHARAGQAKMRIAEVYQNQLQQPLRAAEAYQELNFARGGNDLQLQNATFQIGLMLQSQGRWVEALHVLETFADSFPANPAAGQALTLLGNIHQTNEAWDDAIAAYRRVIADYAQSEFVKPARRSIAECVINLSRWSEAIAAYRGFLRDYPADDKSGEVKARIEILKDLQRYQKVADEEGQRKAFDAQYQIATIVRQKLANPIKAILEFRRVVERWPESHLADDALYEVGATYLKLGDTARARRALLSMASGYPTSPLADDALYLVGKSYEDEARMLVSVTRAESVEKAKDAVQRRAYSMAQAGRRKQRDLRADRIADLKRQGKVDAAENEEASGAAFAGSFASANAVLFAQWADQATASLTATQLADRKDKFDAALRKAVAAYTTASKMAAGDKAGDALLAMAKIQDEQLKDAAAAMKTWLEIVRQFSGTTVAEDASWRIAQYHERAREYTEAIEGYKAFLRNYRRSARAGDAQIAIAENHEQLGRWVNAMDAYTNYINNFTKGPSVEKAKQQIRWIKTYRL